ncbi:MAG: PKD domain-containing protein [Bacteroidota bacterium]|nr:PKD domain-containing protein [Bacteroidota bacterium]
MQKFLPFLNNHVKLYFLAFFLLSFGVQKSQAQYCIPTYTYQCIAPGVNDFIDHFWTTGGITNITNMNSSCNMQANNYIYYAGSNLTVTAGTTFQANMQCGATYQQGYVMWIDWNMDGTFQANEIVYDSGSAGFQVFTANIAVPANAACGTYRMRLRCNFATSTMTPCNNQTYGETEDYNITITNIPPPLTTSFTSGDCGLNNGTATVNPAGLFSYSWNTTPIQTTQTAINLAPGTYTVTVVPGPNCPPAQATVTVTPPVATQSVTVNNIALCNGQSGTLTATPSTPGGTYLWNTGATTQSLTVSPASTTTYSVVYSLNGCPSAPASGTVTVNPIPTVTVNSATICNGQSATLTATPTPAGGTFLWSTGATTPSITVSPASTTTYSVVYTLNGCPSTSVSGTVTVNPAPTATVNNETICNGQSATLTATPSLTGGTYLWNTGATTPGITVSPASTTTYSVVYTLNGCPSTSVSGTVTVNPAPSVTVNNETICDGQSATLTATPSATGGTYLWDTGATTQSITVSPSSTSYYSVIYTLNGCPSTSVSSTVTVNPGPLVTVNNETICNGQSATLTATPTLTGGTYLWNNGQTTQSITVSPTSTSSYSVVYTLNGCPSSSISGVITVNPIPTVAVNNETICNGQSATLTATPSLAGGTYLWDTGATTQSITVSPTSTSNYSVVYTLNGCVSNSSSGTVTVNPVPTVSVNNVTICQGQSATLAATPSVIGGTYLWNNGATTQGITVTPSTTTTYTLVYTINGCSSTSSTGGTVTVNPGPALSVNNETICDGQSATLTATSPLTGGTYLWNNGQTSQNITISPSTTTSYSVVYTLNGCSSNTESGTVTVNPIPTITVNNETICDGQSAILIATPLPATGGTYLWNNGATTQSITVSPVATTSYSVVYTLNGCSSNSESGVVTVNPIPTVTVNNETICDGQSIILTSTPMPYAGGTYLWDNGETTQSITVSPSSTSNYSVVYTLNGCSSPSALGTVTVNPNPTVTVNSETICDGQSATLTAIASAPGGTYLWDNGQTTQSITISPNTTTNYSVVYTLNNCPSSSVSGTVTVNPIPTIIVNNETICDGQSTTLTATPSPATGGSYLWDNGQTTQSITVSPSSTSNYSVVYTLNGCSSSSVSGNVTVNPIPTVTVNSETICDGQSTTLTATPNTVGGSGPAYLWDNGATTQSITVSPSSTTNYSVVYILNGCPSLSVTGTVTVNPIPTGTINSETICIGQSTTLTATTSPATNGNYLWDNGATTQSIVVSPTTTTSYSVVYTLNGCVSNSISGTVNVNPQLNVVNSGNTAICSGSSATISATASGGDGTSYNYSWSPVTGLSDPDISNPVANPSSTTVYTVVLTDNCGTPPVSTSLTVTVNPLPTVVFTGISSGCVPLVAQFNNNSTPGLYSWNFGDGVNDTSASPIHTYNSIGSYDAHLTVIDTNGCKNTSGIYTIQVNPNPIAEYSMGPQPTTILDPLIKFNSEDSSPGITNWNWDFAGFGSSSNANPYFSFPDTGRFDVQLIVINQFGCLDSITQEVEIKGDFTLFTPNAFTPDNDGVNDYFGPQGIGIEEGNFEMFIFNRWGEQIYHTNSLYKPWNGIPNGSTEIAPVGVYIYLINVTDKLKIHHKYQGHFTLK